jgi:GNAT superfamily N-acetyltransferase
VIRNAQRHELDDLRALLADANDTPYDIRIVAEEKCFGRGLAGEPLVRVFEDSGRLRGAAVRCGKYLRLIGVARDSRRRGVGTALLRDAGPEVIAAEPGNYFTPGVLESDAGTIAFLRARGYGERRTTWNMEVDCGSALPQSEHGGEPPPSALEFIERHFGAAWRFEAGRGHVVFREGIGFAAYEANNRGLGTFGPTGVVPSQRGHGYGRDLTLAALNGLRRLGFARAIIPWTDAPSYYANVCGAKAAHRFVTFAVDSGR